MNFGSVTQDSGDAVDGCRQQAHSTYLPRIERAQVSEQGGAWLQCLQAQGTTASKSIIDQYAIW
jgi:hypothetical protein